VWSRFNWLRTSGAGALVNTVMKLRVSKKGEKYIDQPTDCKLLMKDSAPWNYLVV
jgi:hypothetical protein